MKREDIIGLAIWSLIQTVIIVAMFWVFKPAIWWQQTIVLFCTVFIGMILLHHIIHWNNNNNNHGRR